MASAVVFAVVACFAVLHGASASLQEAFGAATSSLDPPPAGKFYTNGTATKELLVQAVESYLTEMDQMIGRMTYDSLRYYEKAHSNFVNNIYYVASHPEQFEPVSYDVSLVGLAPIYRRVVALVQDGASSASSQSSQAKNSRRTRIFTPWTPEEVFTGLPDIVSGGLSDYRSWLLNFVDAGLAAANKEAATIMREQREKVLFPSVSGMQVVASRLQEQMEAELESHSSPEVWADYVAAREQLLSVEFVP